MAAAMMQPHMISQWAAPRPMPRRKMKRVATNSTKNRLNRMPRLVSRNFGRANACHPRRQYMRVGGRWSHIV
jgi:hypothetical protein